MRKTECLKGAFYTAFGIGILISFWLSAKVLVIILALALMLMGFGLLAKHN